MKLIITILTYLGEEIRDWFEHGINNMPGRIGRVARRSYWSSHFTAPSDFTIAPGCVIEGAKGMTMGQKVRLRHNCSLYAHNNGRLVIGDRCSIGSNVLIGASDGSEIIIGNDVMISPNVLMRSSNHRYERKDIVMMRQGHEIGKIIIEDDVWICSGAVLLPNAIIRKGAIVAAGAIVNSEIPAYTMAGGMPAKVIKENPRS